MAWIWDYVWAFLIGGAFCVIAQLLIDLTGMTSVAFLKKSVFTGSHQGMNFMIKK